MLLCPGVLELFQLQAPGTGQFPFWGCICISKIVIFANCNFGHTVILRYLQWTKLNPLSCWFLCAGTHKIGRFSRPPRQHVKMWYIVSLQVSTFEEELFSYHCFKSFKLNPLNFTYNFQGFAHEMCSVPGIAKTGLLGDLWSFFFPKLEDQLLHPNSWVKLESQRTQPWSLDGPAQVVESSELQSIPSWGFSCIGYIHGIYGIYVTCRYTFSHQMSCIGTIFSRPHGWWMVHRDQGSAPTLSLRKRRSAGRGPNAAPGNSFGFEGSLNLATWGKV